METITREYYVSLEVAQLLKKAGFDRKVKQYYFTQNGKTELKYNFKHPAQNYNKSMATMDSKSFEFEVCSCPTLDVAQRWLREVKGVHMCVKADAASINCKYFVTVIISDTKWGNVQDENKKTILFNTYEEAQAAGIKKALEIILNKAL